MSHDPRWKVRYAAYVASYKASWDSLPGVTVEERARNLREEKYPPAKPTPPETVSTIAREFRSLCKRHGWPKAIWPRYLGRCDGTSKSDKS